MDLQARVGAIIRSGWGDGERSSGRSGEGVVERAIQLDPNYQDCSTPRRPKAASASLITAPRDNAQRGITFALARRKFALSYVGKQVYIASQSS